MQNGEFQAARDRAEVLLEKYTDLYDFAPAGYFSLDEQGQILEANLTGAALLGLERSRLIHRRLAQFVAPTSQPRFRAFLEQVFVTPRKEVCEVSLLKTGGAPFWAQLLAASAVSLSGPRRWCRVVLSDITVVKHAEEAQRRSEGLMAANRELKQEIVRRQTVEKALKQSEQHQGSLLEQSRHMQEQLRHLSHQILRAQEEERKRISRELHDEITQTLVGINVHLETLVRQATVQPTEFKRQIVRTQRLVEKALHSVHEFARELRPTALDDLGLIATLHSYMKDFAKRTGIHVHFKTFTSGHIAELDNATRTVAYRVVQEALTNVARHAQASQVELRIQKVPGAILLEIKDNGKAFDVERLLRAKRHRHLGLLGMRERVEMIGGNLRLTSAPGQGTVIRAQIPFGPIPTHPA